MKTNLRFVFFAVFAVFFCAPFTAVAQVTKITEHFIQDGAIGNQFEISSSQAALQKSQNNAVKQFAQQMVDDHTQVASQMQAALSASNLGVPQPSPALDPKHQKILDKLNSAAGADFDKKYIRAQLDAHNDAVHLFRDYAKSGDNDTMKNFASQTLPTLEQHQKEIKQLAQSQ